MVKRSLQSSASGIQQARRAFALKGWTQENLAAEVNLKTRQPIWRFFTGQPVDRQIFIELCLILDLEWRDIADNPPAEFPEPGETASAAPQAIDDLVRMVRSHYHETIQHQCGTLQLLEIGRPVSIEDIYVDVNILEKLSSQPLDRSELKLGISGLKNLDPSEINRVGLGDVEQPQISGQQAVETYSKLRVLGRPGVGKTTFLQHLAIQCNRGEFAAHQVPFFVLLKDFAEESRRHGHFNLFSYIHYELMLAGVANPETLTTLLQSGRMLLLLDGIDELSSDDISSALREIRKFSDKYYRNRFVISCRTATNKLQPQGFTDIEIAPFTSQQITIFAQKWFTALGETMTVSGPAQADQFIQELNLSENWQFRQLVVTPLFLHLACWVFQRHGEFPAKQADFYKRGVDLLLGQWDEARGVERDDAYQKFSLPQRLRLLSQLAAITYEKGQYFFEQRTIENYIGDYLQNLEDVALPPEELQLESEAMLRAIESQHGILIERARGIFSFSYLAFQEYFTARHIVASHNLQGLEQTLGNLVSHITDPHWREVFLLTVTMLRSADPLVQLMKQQIDALVSQDPHLQDFLQWANQKSATVPTEPKLAPTRSFYLTLAQNPETAAQFTLARILDQGMFLDAALENILLEFSTNHSQDSTYVNTCNVALNNILVMALDAGFYKAIQQLKDQLPVPSQNHEQLEDWWQINYATWVQKLREEVAQHRNIHHPWQFSPEQQQVLQNYYDANQLLVDCLDSNCEITAELRQTIEATLLLPQLRAEKSRMAGQVIDPA